ncbi:hypothetical protein B0H13DRAFT_1874923 [Mycena leptocephala]|nr:hypothetical protein B0H13DRAFT_1874923 [Mycena leptocephala]
MSRRRIREYHWEERSKGFKLRSMCRVATVQKLQEFKRKNNNDLSFNLCAICRLCTLLRHALRRLRTVSSSTQTSIEIDSLLEGINFYTSRTKGSRCRLCS